MEPSLLTTYLLPAALGVIMLGLGLTLTPDDFRRVVRYPKAVFVGLFCQMLVLPAVCFGIAKARRGSAATCAVRSWRLIASFFAMPTCAT